MSNNLEGLNDHLFDQLKRLESASTPEELKQEIGRSGAVVDVASQVVANASLALKATEVAEQLKPKRVSPGKKNLRLKVNGVDQSPKAIVPEVMPSMLAIGPSVKGQD